MENYVVFRVVLRYDWAGKFQQLFDFCLSITARFDNKHMRSLPFYTPEGAWPLSQLSGGEFAFLELERNFDQTAMSSQSHFSEDSPTWYSYGWK